MIDWNKQILDFKSRSDTMRVSFVLCAALATSAIAVNLETSQEDLKDIAETLDLAQSAIDEGAQLDNDVSDLHHPWQVDTHLFLYPYNPN